MNRTALLLVVAGCLVTVLLGAAILSVPFYKLYWIPQGGMFPTLQPGARVIARKHAYETIDQIERGEIIVWRYLEGDKAYIMVWRVVGLPGDSVQLAGTELVINGLSLPHRPVRAEGDLEVFQEQLSATPHEVAYDRTEDQNEIAVVVPPGHLFVLGDNRDHAADSRVYGFVPFEAVVGRLVWWP